MRAKAAGGFRGNFAAGEIRQEAGSDSGPGCPFREKGRELWKASQLWAEDWLGARPRGRSPRPGRR